MKILVPVKRVLDYNVKPRVKSDGSGVDLANVKMSMNPFDEIAVEEAIRLKEKGVATEIVAVSVGPAKAQETLRTALAMGADRAILVQTDDEVEPLAIAKILKAIGDADREWEKKNSKDTPGKAKTEEEEEKRAKERAQNRKQRQEFVTQKVHEAMFKDLSESDWEALEKEWMVYLKR